MKKIIELPPFIYNRISAGEVVEGPLSIIKELVENSIDANASMITIKITDGGKDKIVVIDNGDGMSADDIKKCILPHATSKIKKISDLDNITTLGFRGEALSSITSVAKVSIVSRTKENSLGSRILCNEDIIDYGQVGAPFGTTVTVVNLFDNVPARKKFLKRGATQQAQITDWMKKFIISNYKIKINYIANEKAIFQSDGYSLESAVSEVYSKELLNDIFYVSYSNNNYRLHGYIGKPYFSRYDKTCQILLVNNRLVSDEDISNCIDYNYKDYVMKKQHSFFILFFDLPYNNVDVNVHPTKSQVKFENKNLVLDFISASVRDALDKELNKNDAKDKTIFEREKIECKTNLKVAENSINNFSLTEAKTLAEEIQRNKNTLAEEIQRNKNTFAENESLGIISANKKNKIFINDKIESNNTIKNIDPKIQLEFDSVINFKILGTLFSTYLLIENENKFYMIDQHAAHERILFDKIMNIMQAENGTYQLFEPIVFEVNNYEAQRILEIQKVYKDLGFGFEEFGHNVFRLISVPQYCQDLDFNIFISEFLIKIKDKVMKSDFIREDAAMIACKSAIKANTKITDEEIKYILDKLSKTKVLLCPHGRPIILQYEKNQIEKMFRRSL